MDNKQATLELGTRPVGKLLAQYALPAIVAMTASSLYNMIDSIFIGQGVGPLAISGLAITFPLMNLSAAFGAAVGIGSSTCISVKLGQKDYDMAENIFGKNAGKAIPRTYTIRSLVEGSNRYYYLIVEDAQKVFGVMRIGRAIGQEKFQAEIDMLSRIHLLMPVSPKVGHYLAFSIDGENIANEYRKTTSTIPSLLRDPVSGTVSLVGGEPARIGIDFKDPSYGKTRASKLIEDDADDDAGVKACRNERHDNAFQTGAGRAFPNAGDETHSQ